MKNRIYKRIFALMDQRGMNQKDLAKKAGVSEVTITKIKKGGSIDLDTLDKIEQALDATLLLVSNEDLK